MVIFKLDFGTIPIANTVLNLRKSNLGLEIRAVGWNKFISGEKSLAQRMKP